MDHGTSGRSTFGGLLRALREQRSWSQEHLADRAGISVRTVRNLEHDRIRRPQYASVTRLADALGLVETSRAAFVGAANTAAVQVGIAQLESVPAQRVQLVLENCELLLGELRRMIDSLPAASE